MKSWRSEDRQGVLSQYCILNGEAVLLVGTQNMETWKTTIIIVAPQFDVSDVWAIHNPQSINSLWRRASARNVDFTTGLITFFAVVNNSVYRKTSSSLLHHGTTAEGLLLFIDSYDIDCKTVRIFAYSSKRKQSNKRSGTRLKTESDTGERR